MITTIEWVDDVQEKIVEERRISLPNVVSGASVLRVTGSRTVGRTGQNNKINQRDIKNSLED